MANATTEMTYLTEEKIGEYIVSLPAVIIDWTARSLTEGDQSFNASLAGVEQFSVEVYVYCVKGDDESDYQWWERGLSALAEAEGLDADNVQFVIYPDDENNPNSWKCECGWWDGEDHECVKEDEVEETEVPNKVTVLWDKVLKAVYQDEPRADATADDDGEYTTEAFVRDDYEAKIAKAIKKAWKASRRVPLSELPDISKQGDFTDSYYMAVEDSQGLEFEDDDDVQEMLEEVLEFVTAWSGNCESR